MKQTVIPGSRVVANAVDPRDEGLVLIKPEESGKVVKRDKFNNPPRVVPCERTVDIFGFIYI